MNTKTEFQDRNYLNKELKEMFFSLDLIQSYGSGIRQAKKAMTDNSSPALIFEPNNDVDDYTMDTAYINDEFARVKAEEEGRSLAGSGFKNGTENGTERIPEAAIAFLQNYKNKKRATAERIMRLIVSNSHITILKMTKLSGSSERTVKRYLKEFQEADVLRRAGSDTSGEWILS